MVDSLTSRQTTEKGKAKQIYRWVQQHIKYVAFEDGLEGFRPRQAADVCNKRYGDCKDMSSIITQMLQLAGIKAYYTWIGTRLLPYDYTELPLPIVDNHMISTASIDGKWYFLDGTDPNSKLELPPSSIQDKEALVAISENEYKVIRVPVAAAEDNMMIDSTFISFTDAGIKGVEKVNYYGYFGEDVYNTLMYKDEKNLKDYVNTRMGKASNKFILGKYSVNKTDAGENIANITADFEIPGYSKKAGNEYYINLNLEKLFDYRVIDTAKRKVPRESEFKYVIKQYHILEIPRGYSVAYKPDDFTFSNDLVSIKIAYQVKDGKIIAAQELKNKKLMIYPSDFDAWNKAIKAVQPQYKETVVLEQK
ncbi:MAG: transglutaminase domain-containing protein [Chitinophagaceae bacterium]|nr:transglutaminase domain-containing protein [Chitinophagaceae bacterium]